MIADLFFIEYDLRKQRNYQPLWNELRRLGAKRVLESCWSLKFPGSNCQALRNHFLQYIDDDDGLIVSQVTDWASHRTLESPHYAKAAA